MTSQRHGRLVLRYIDACAAGRAGWLCKVQCICGALAWLIDGHIYRGAKLQIVNWSDWGEVNAKMILKVVWSAN